MTIRRLLPCALVSLFFVLSLPHTGWAAASSPSASPAAGADATNEFLNRWFREQDRLLDDILLRLTRIEGLVRELHRAIQQMPVSLPGPAPAASPVPPAPVAVTATIQNPPVPAALPVPPAALPAPAVAVPVAPVTAPVAVPVVIPARAKPAGILGFFYEWGTELAAIGMLVLVTMMSVRNRRDKRIAAAMARAD